MVDGLVEVCGLYSLEGILNAGALFPENYSDHLLTRVFIQQTSNLDTTGIRGYCRVFGVGMGAQNREWVQFWGVGAPKILGKIYVKNAQKLFFSM